MRKYSFVLLAVLTLAACASEPRPAELGPTPVRPDPTAAPGGTLPMGQSSLLADDGTYFLPEGDFQIEFLCWGSVDYSVTVFHWQGGDGSFTGGCAGGGGIGTGPRAVKGPGRIEASFYTPLSYLTVRLF